MKKSAEQEIKRLVHTWDEKSSDIGYDRTLVWDTINTNAPTTKRRITWQRIAVAIIILFLLGGWGHSEYTNTQLAQSKMAMASEIQSLKSTVKAKQSLPSNSQIIAQIAPDTIVKIIVKEVLINGSTEELRQLKNQHQQSLTKLTIVQKELDNRNQVLSQFEDSLAILSNSLQVYKQTEVNEDVKLAINEEALIASLENTKEDEYSSSQPKNKVKLVLFNKSKSTISKAPANGRIRL